MRRASSSTPLRNERCKQLWLVTLARHLGGGYSVRESPRLFLLSEDENAAALARLEHLERVLDVIIDALEGIGPPGGALPVKLAVLYFTDDDDYYAYISHYYPPEWQFGPAAPDRLTLDERVDLAKGNGS